MTETPRIDCEEAVRHLAAYLDGERDEVPAAALESHLERCRSCFSRAEFERQLKARMRRELGDSDPPPWLREKMRTLIHGLAREG